MLANSDWLNNIINNIIQALPVVGVLLLLSSEAGRRRFEKIEWVGIFCIVWGFILFVFWQMFELPRQNYLFWFEGWLIPIVWGLVFTVMAGVQINRQARLSLIRQKDNLIKKNQISIKTKEPTNLDIIKEIRRTHRITAATFYASTGIVGITLLASAYFTKLYSVLLGFSIVILSIIFFLWIMWSHLVKNNKPRHK